MDAEPSLNGQSAARWSKRALKWGGGGLLLGALAGLIASVFMVSGQAPTFVTETVVIGDDGTLYDVPPENIDKALGTGRFRQLSAEEALAEKNRREDEGRKKALETRAAISLGGGCLGAVCLGAVPALVAAWYLLLTMFGQVAAALRGPQGPRA